MAINTDLFMEIRDAILAEPDRINMGYGLSIKRGCGTSGCIAGWACILKAGMRHTEDDEIAANKMLKFFEISGGLDFFRHTQPEAIKALGISYYDAQELFFFHDSQVGIFGDLAKKLRNITVGTSKYAAVVVEAIDRFLASKGLDVPNLVREYHHKLGARIIPEKPEPVAAAKSKQQQTVLEQVIERSAHGR